jgi:4-phospho-D-threonate 3-dehydrogenase / 4-phospho-D-erythronate 3-dehydrogenase
VNNVNNTPIVGITMGDAAGIGPEVIMKALAEPEVYAMCRPVVIGDAKILERANGIVGGSSSLRRIAQPSEGRFQPGTVDCIDLDLLPGDLAFGQISAAAGDAAFRYVERAIQLAKKHEIDAICTAPLNKEALHKGGHIYPGHTEILADLTGTQDFAMMLTARNLRVIHVTTHVGLIDAVNMITPERVLRVIKLVDATLRKAGIDQPNIAVCGINPHAGEHGLFGHGEDEQKVLPAVERARAEGIAAHGPLPADTVFFRAGRGDFDAVVAMYHDQGHAPVKVLGLEAGVNITVGLPIIRTSVDHGTAFDIAGSGAADPASMLEALRQAALLAPKRAGAEVSA